jgi:hypothetical protein
MKTPNRLLAALLLSFCAAGAMGQSVLAGKYKGSYVTVTRTGNSTVGITLDVKEVTKEGKVRADVVMSNNGSCDGTYPMSGNLAASSLTLKSTKKSGVAKDCSFGMNLRLEGSDKLSGKTTGGRAITLTK